MTCWKPRLVLILIGVIIFFCNQSSTRNVPQSNDLPVLVHDLYSIFKDEIHSDAVGNVYQGVRNQFQLDGNFYATVLKALNAYDISQKISSFEASKKNRLLSKSLKVTRDTFSSLLKELPWPKIQIQLEPEGFEFKDFPELVLYQKISQPILLRIHNSTSQLQKITLPASDFIPKKKSFEIQPAMTRYFLSSLAVSEMSQREAIIKIESKIHHGQKKASLKVHETGVLVGKLVENSDGTPALGRVRVIDKENNYRFPVDSSYGLILRPRANATRWNYVNENFRIRAPSGKLAISIRRGLEYTPLEEEVFLPPNKTIKKTFRLKRWANMEKEGWYSGDTHIHMLNPTSALFEMKAEDLRVSNVLIFSHLGETYSQQYFKGKVDPISDSRHLVYYNEEYRNQQLGHVSLLNLKQLITPLSTGGLAHPTPNILRYSFLDPSGQGHPKHGQPGSPDFPLLLEVMRETHRQQGLVNWAHLRPAQREFPIDMVFGAIDTADILTHTRLPEALKLWYHLLNCGFRLPATAGTDRIGPEEAIGHQRVYVKLTVPFTYQSWINGLRKGQSFVTNGPMISLSVNGLGAGDELSLKKGEVVQIKATAFSHRSFERLELVVNGQPMYSTSSRNGGKEASLLIDHFVDKSLWIAARCSGGWPEERSIWTHPLFAHTNPVYVSYQGNQLKKSQSGCYLLEFLKPLERWVQEDAYFSTQQQKEHVLTTIQQGMAFYEELCSAKANP
ncbi:MAG: CehA/McbA family metallohydrolase [Acidobacteriia bacterium]|nr:CehA/McbA family metallohydrolase [Terriglobia bacterium]